MKKLTLILLTLSMLITGCTSYVQTAQELTLLDTPKDDNLSIPLMATKQAQIIGVHGDFCTNKKLMGDTALIIFPHPISGNYKGRYIITREDDYIAKDTLGYEWIKSAKQQHAIIKINNAGVRP